MSMSPYEYKTTALPKMVQQRRRRNLTEVEAIAETLAETIQAGAVDGWEYMRAETLVTTQRSGFFSKVETETTCTVLIFRRARSAAWADKTAPRDAQAKAAADPTKPPARARAPVGIDDPTSPLAGGGFLSASGAYKAEAARSEPPRPTTLRPPLGSAQD